MGTHGANHHFNGLVAREPIDDTRHMSREYERSRRGCELLRRMQRQAFARFASDERITEEQAKMLLLDRRIK
jgi:hypothetical protein